MGARASEYGDAKQNFQDIADLWSVFLGRPDNAPRGCRLHGLGKIRAADEIQQRGLMGGHLRGMQLWEESNELLALQSKINLGRR